MNSELQRQRGVWCDGTKVMSRGTRVRVVQSWLGRVGEGEGEGEGEVEVEDEDEVEVSIILGERAWEHPFMMSWNRYANDLKERTNAIIDIDPSQSQLPSNDDAFPATTMTR
jgi:hypothetical protein